MPKKIRGWLLLLILALLGACASGGARSDDGSFVSRDLLTREQIDQSRATNAFDAVQRLRSNWMRVRGSAQMPSSADTPQFQENQVVVYLDGQRLGGVPSLRNIEIAAVEYIRHFSPAEATARWGFNHGGGVIYVSTRPLEP